MKSWSPLHSQDPSGILRVWRRQRLFAVLLGAWSFLAGSALGRETNIRKKVVKNANELRMAIEDGYDEIILRNGNYKLGKAIPDITKSVTLRGQKDKFGERPIIVSLDKKESFRALHVKGGQLTVESLVFRGFRESVIRVEKDKGGALFVRDSLFSGNNSNGAGAAIFADCNTDPIELEVRDSAFVNNSAKDPGGVIYIKCNVTNQSKIISSSFYRNEASSITVWGQPAVVIQRSTFLSSSKSIFSIHSSRDQKPTLNLSDSTLLNSGSRASSGSSIVTGGVSRFTVKNSILAGPGKLCSHKGVSEGYNLYSDETCFIKTVAGDTKKSIEDMKLGNITDNGGPTQTISLQPGSPALNNGQCLGSLDQRGVQRPQERVKKEGKKRCDIGAYEAICKADDNPDDKIIPIDIYVDFNRSSGGNHPVLNDETCQIDRVTNKFKTSGEGEGPWRIVWRINPHPPLRVKDPELGIKEVKFFEVKEDPGKEKWPKILLKKTRKKLETKARKSGKPWQAYKIDIDLDYSMHDQTINCSSKSHDSRPHCWWYTLKFVKKNVDLDDWDPRMEEDPDPGGYPLKRPLSGEASDEAAAQIPGSR